MVVLDGAVSTHLTYEIARYLNVPLVHPVIERFPGHEWSIHMDSCSVHHQDVLVVHGFYTPPNQQPLLGKSFERVSFHDALIASLCIARTAKQQGARTVTLLCPFMPYGRQNKEGCLSLCHMFFEIMGTSGVDRVITLDLHGATESMPSFVSCLNSTPLWEPFFQNAPPPTVVATDTGGQKRAELLAHALNAPLLFLEKKRLSNGSCTIDVPTDTPAIGPFLLLDDIVDTGSTLCQAIHALRTHHRDASFFVCATHGLWSQDCVDKIQKMNIKKIWVSDSITCHSPLGDNVTVVPCAPLLAQHILTKTLSAHTQKAI